MMVGSPQTLHDFIEDYGEGVYACTLLLRDVSSGDVFALGEIALRVWNWVKERRLEVLDVLYTGNDRNKAIRTAEEYNKKQCA